MQQTTTTPAGPFTEAQLIAIFPNSPDPDRSGLLATAVEHYWAGPDEVGMTAFLTLLGFSPEEVKEAIAILPRE